ncbi:MAG TPA: SLC13/DASS family transporter, partial [Thermoclostridium sp.]|nr:SLC13/DASS family transporter [Thermoclostridium sp.]
SIAATLGVSVYPFAMGVIIASSISISTPIATSPMTLVVGMGGYKFMDYVKVGGLLNLVMLIVSIVLIPVIWPF